MSFQVGDRVVVVNPTRGLPAFSVSGKIYTVVIVEKDPSGDNLRLHEITNYWAASRFNKFETKRLR